MPSPFPGMDPYLEDPARWRDLHQRLMTHAGERLQRMLRPNYVVQLEERMYVASSERLIIPDVTILRPPLREPRESYGVTAIAEPYVLILSDDPTREPFMQIIVPQTGEVVTVIEVISPTNKQDHRGYAHYRQKREEVLNSSAHLVEIDLLGEGERVIPPVKQRSTGLPLGYRYIISVNRAQDRVRYEMYPLQLGDRLPNFRIPLKPEHTDVTLDLQAVFEQCYENGAYDLLIDYGKPPPVALSDAERAFVANVLQRSA